MPDISDLAARKFWHHTYMTGVAHHLSERDRQTLLLLIPNSQSLLRSIAIAVLRQLNPLQWNDLPDIDKVLPISEEDEAY